MAAELFKLVMNAVTTTGTTSRPAVEKYFYNLRAADRTSGTVTIPYTQFYDDNGNSMLTNLTTVATNNGYYLLFVNGALQQSALFTVSAGGSRVIITQASTTPVSAAISLVVNNFGPVSTSTTTVST